MSEQYIAYAGSRVSLAAMKREYIPTFVQYANDLSATEGILMRPPMTLEDELAWYDGLTNRKQTDQVFAILHNGSGGGAGASEHRYIGHTGIHHMAWPDGTATSGTIIFDTSLHAKGCGTEAKLLLLYHAFFVKGLRKMSSEVKAFNGNSWGHLLKCGYRTIGRQKQHRFHDGAFVDCILFEIFREEFVPIWEQYKKAGVLPSLTDEQRALIEKETGRKMPVQE